VKYKLIREGITGEDPEIDLPEGFIILDTTYHVKSTGDPEDPKPVEGWIITYLEPVKGDQR